MGNVVRLAQSSYYFQGVVDMEQPVLPDLENVLTLEELLAKATAENLHPEVDTGTPVGNEVW